MKIIPSDPRARTAYGTYVVHLDDQELDELREGRESSEYVANALLARFSATDKPTLLALRHAAELIAWFNWSLENDVVKLTFIYEQFTNWLTQYQETFGEVTVPGKLKELI